MSRLFVFVVCRTAVCCRAATNRSLFLFCGRKRCLFRKPMMVCFIRTPGERNSTGLRFSGDEGGRARAAGASRGAAKTSGGSRVFGPARKYGSMRITCSSSFLLRHWFSKTMMKRWTKVITMMIMMLKLYFSMSRIKFRTHGQRWTEVELFHFRSKPRSAEPGLPFCEETDVDLIWGRSWSMFWFPQVRVGGSDYCKLSPRRAGVS